MAELGSFGNFFSRADLLQLKASAKNARIAKNAEERVPLGVLGDLGAKPEQRAALTLAVSRWRSSWHHPYGSIVRDRAHDRARHSAESLKISEKRTKTFFATPGLS